VSPATTPAFTLELSAAGTDTQIAAAGVAADRTQALALVGAANGTVCT
jgi:hypothetical protein